MLHWKNAILGLLLIIFLLWMFAGGKEYEYIGLKPLLGNQLLPQDVPLHTGDIENTSWAERKNPVVQTVQRESGFTSRGERLCREYIENHYNRPFPNCRPDFLRNPETGQNLELDCYNEELGIAIEYSGQQHYVYPNGLHRTRDDFLRQLRRDKFKVKCCEKNGVYLIRVPYTVRWNEIPQYIYERLPENRKEDDGL